MQAQFRVVAITAVVALAMGACEGGSSSPHAPTVTLTSSATDVAVNGVVTLTWSTTHATSCIASGAWNHPQGIDGSEGVLVSQTSTYTISCTGRGGVATDSVTIHAWSPPSASLTADLISVLPNGTVQVTWSSQNSKTCVGSGGLSGTLALSGSQTLAPLTETTKFAIECSNPVFGAATSTVVVTVVVPKYTVLELPMWQAVDVNDAGDVVGYIGALVVWSGGGVVGGLGCSNPPYCYSRYIPVAMNSARTVIGREHFGSGMSWSCFRWHVGDAAVYTLFSGGPAGISDINDAGQIVGGSPGPGAWLFSDDTVVLLFGSNGSNSIARAINNAGHITGYVVPGTDGIKHLFLYVDGTIQDLGAMDGASSDAQDINRADEIVGSAGTAVATRAFLYANSRFTDLGSLGGTSNGATAINDVGQIVGTSTLAGADPQAQRAFLYVDGRMFDLNDLAAPLPVPLTEARKINNRGQIIANACPPPGTNGSCRAYLLTPVTPP